MFKIRVLSLFGFIISESWEINVNFLQIDRLYRRRHLYFWIGQLTSRGSNYRYLSKVFFRCDGLIKRIIQNGRRGATFFSGNTLMCKLFGIFEISKQECYAYTLFLDVNYMEGRWFEVWLIIFIKMWKLEIFTRIFSVRHHHSYITIAAELKFYRNFSWLTVELQFHQYKNVYLLRTKCSARFWTYSNLEI